MLAIVFLWALLAPQEAFSAPIPVHPQARIIQNIVLGKGSLPSLASIQEAAARAVQAGSEDEAEDWAQKARLRALLPDLKAELGSDQDRFVRAGYGNSDYIRTGRGLRAEISLRFQLSGLLYSGEEIAVNRQRIARAAAIRLAVEAVTRVYFERLRVELELKLQSTPELWLKAAELDGLLAAMTEIPSDAAISSDAASTPIIHPVPQKGSLPGGALDP